MCRYMYICIDLYMCMNMIVHVCPYIGAYDAFVCTFLTMYSAMRMSLMSNCPVNLIYYYHYVKQKHVYCRQNGYAKQRQAP